jgi:hypothetical protein
VCATCNAGNAVGCSGDFRLEAAASKLQYCVVRSCTRSSVGIASELQREQVSCMRGQSTVQLRPKCQQLVAVGWAGPRLAPTSRQERHHSPGSKGQTAWQQNSMYGCVPPRWQ